MKEGIPLISEVMNVLVVLQVPLSMEHSPSLHEDMQKFWLGGDERFCI